MNINIKEGLDYLASMLLFDYSEINNGHTLYEDLFLQLAAARGCKAFADSCRLIFGQGVEAAILRVAQDLPEQMQISDDDLEDQKYIYAGADAMEELCKACFPTILGKVRQYCAEARNCFEERLRNNNK